MLVLGISALYHDSAAAIIRDGVIIAAAQEERFSRIKHDRSIPFDAIDYCLKEANCKNGMRDLDAVVYYDNPLLTYDRFVHNAAFLGDCDKFVEEYIPEVFGERFRIDEKLKERYGILGRVNKLYVTEHHVSHAASAFFPSPFEEAAILTIDGVGEWETLTIGKGRNGTITLLEEIRYPHSLGLFYSTFTSFCGFKVNSGDYKFMGLAPYGDPIYYDDIINNVIRVNEDGSFKLNLSYFDFYSGSKMYSKRMEELFGGPARERESRITKREMDIAASVQRITEEVVIKICKHAKELTGANKLCMAGGVSLNCVANGKIVKAGIFDNIWIQPAAGDAGGALGCALYYYYKNNSRKISDNTQNGTQLGPSYSDDEVVDYLNEMGYSYQHFEESTLLYDKVAELLDSGRIVGWFRGRMEFGPRALGNRSILADPRADKMQSKLNLSVKFRESFRPFAPSVIEEDSKEYFDLDVESPFMLLVGHVNENRRVDFNVNESLREAKDDMITVLNSKRSDIPAVTHVDYSSRIQTVSRGINKDFYDLLCAFRDRTGCSVLVNTSFNVRGEPIVNSLNDAYTCFMRTRIDVLVLENCILYKEDQKEWNEEKDWKNEYELD